MTEDEFKGKAREVKGRVKDAMGGLTNDPEMQVEGKIDKLTGKAQNTLGKVERDLKKKDEEEQAELDRDLDRP